MKVPSDRDIVAEGLSLLRRSPQHDLPRWFRRRVLLTMGHPGSQEGHARRVELAIRSAEKVMPIWSSVFGSDDTPRRAIDLARTVMAGAVRPEEAMRPVDLLSTRVDDLSHGLNRADRATMAGQAAIAAAIGAVDDLEFGWEEGGQAASDEQLQPGGDSFMAAAAAWSDGFPWLGSGDVGRRLEFWEWWLDAARSLQGREGDGVVRPGPVPYARSPRRSVKLSRGPPTMKRPIFFCKSWFRAKKRPTEVWTEEQARAAREKGTLYTVLVDSAERPWCFLEFNGAFVGVGFLDDRLREFLYYAFSRQDEDGRLFLTNATHRDFEGSSDVVTEGTTYVFRPNGTVKVQRRRFHPHSLETKDETADVSGNYSPWPEFGEYDDLIRVERG